MNTTSLILQLLIHDMQHEQLVTGLRRLGFESGLHHTDLSEAVAVLMGLTEESMPQQWLDLYMKFLKEAPQYPITETGSGLRPLADAAY